MGRILSIVVLGLTSATSAQQIILPSNATISPVSGTELRLYLLNGRANNMQTAFHIAPLTGSAGIGQSRATLDVSIPQQEDRVNYY